MTEKPTLTDEEFRALLALDINPTAEYGETTAKEMFMKLLASWRSYRAALVWLEQNLKMCVTHEDAHDFIWDVCMKGHEKAEGALYSEEPGSISG